jgi:alpha-beta hydrolase superfamily lysophospholipase
MSWRARLLKWSLYAVALCAVVLVTIVLVFAIQSRLRLADLEPWHEIVLSEEFRADRAGAPKTFDEYRALEDRLFAQLKTSVLDDPKKADKSLLGRYTPGSITSKLALETPYNRSFELVPDEIRGAVLLVHGLSDSPYSMRALAETFYAQGYYVLALRLPGHGTLPSGLLNVSWRDWYAAVELAAKHAAAKAGPGKPFVAGGYSTGAALLALYSLRSLDDESLPRPRQIYLLSAAIGVSPFAVLTNVISSLGFVPGLEKSHWLDVLPEYDPYKYNSFTVNGASQIYKVTREIRAAIESARDHGHLDGMPRVTMFQSLVDATVTPAEVVRGMLGLLPPHGHELVVFDVNRYEVIAALTAPGPLTGLERLRAADDLPFRLTIVTNREPGTRSIAAFTRDVGARGLERHDLPLEWPRGVFSLGHTALPFPVDDPVYGLEGAPDDGRPGFNIGSVPVRGENGALVVPLGTFARLRSNPFFDVIREQIVGSLADAGASAGR